MDNSAKFRESAQLSLHFKWTTAEISRKADCAKAQMDLFTGSTSSLSAVWVVAFMNIIYEWTSTLLNFPEVPHGN